ncbi:helix-turn-helix domain-containing protein [Olleya sp. R77988]|uniref:helix-turn-helix domain-containing protein n=1 Tax=Olleya sp. R77988 TaxID=3093875 RepID=UPI0037C8DB3B
MKILIIDDNGITEFHPATPNQNNQSQKTSTFEILQEKQKEKEGAPKVYSISKLVALFETTRPTIYSWIGKGLLKPIKLGGRVYFNHKDIETLLVQKSNPQSE